eukprot:498152_1
MGCWIWCRLFHSKRNWLKVIEVQQTYSTSQTICATILPLACIIFVIIYMNNVLANNDANNVRYKDAKPFFRSDSMTAYYEHMHQDFDISLAVDSEQQYYPQSLTLHQFYKNDNWDYSDYVDQSPKITNLDTSNEYKARAQLFYADPNNGLWVNGVVLCREDELNNTATANGITIDLSTLYGRDSEELSSQSFYHVVNWKAAESMTVTLQLWIYYDAQLVPVWRGNELEIVNIAYHDRKHKKPDDYGGYDASDESECYGIKFNMSRNVYESKDGFNPVTFVNTLFAIIGAGYSFWRLVCTNCSTLMSMCCCKSCDEKDPQQEQEKNLEMVTHTGAT